MVVEVALWMPVILLLIAGVIQFGKITYLYYTLRKIEYTVARSVSVASGVDFCPDATDTLIQGPLNSRSPAPPTAPVRRWSRISRPP